MSKKLMSVQEIRNEFSGVVIRVIALRVNGHEAEFVYADVEDAASNVRVSMNTTVQAKVDAIVSDLVSREVVPYRVVDESGASCYGDAAYSVLYNKITPLSEDKVAEIKDKVENAQDVAEPVVTKETAKAVMHEIRIYSAQSRYSNIPDYKLFANVGIDRKIGDYIVERLRRIKKIEVRRCGNFRVIYPFGLAPKVQPKVSKEDCMKVFEYILKYESASRYLNVSKQSLEKTVGIVVGVLTLDRCLEKLVKAGYVEARAISPSCTVYSTTRQVELDCYN